MLMLQNFLFLKIRSYFLSTCIIMVPGLLAYEQTLKAYTL
uniref:Uncharacterized protein n=1 Tax=Rhizophora mucronata TaxID=61149 RepID=A0A2P2NJY2_RHIMU